MEFIWRPNSKSLGNDTQIFTHALYQHYSAPSGFGFDAGQNDPFWINTKSSQGNEDFNGDEEAAKLKAYLDI